MPEIRPGLTHAVEVVVTDELTADRFGNTGVYVLGTPALVNLFEICSGKGVLPFLQQGQSTVGTYLEVHHLKATPVGMKVTVRSVLEAVEGRKLVFRLEAEDETGQIGACVHHRYIVELEKFLQRAGGKG